MNPRVKDEKANQDFTLLIEFTNYEKKLFDVKPYLDIGIFKELKNFEKFRQVNAYLGSIQLTGGQDLCPDTLYLESTIYTTKF